MHKKSRPEMRMLWQNDNKKTQKLCKLTVDKCGFMRYNLTCKEQKKQTQMEVHKMKKHTQGWYTFEDGARIWVRGFSKNEMKWEVIKHGKLVSFVPTFE